MKAVKVLWIDSCNSNMNWTVAEDIEVEPMYIDSFGVVVKDTDEFLTIAQNYGNDPEQYSNITTMPKGCIKEVFVIHEDNVCKNEQKPQRMVSAEAKEALYDKPAWSEEDEHRINRISDFIWKNRKGDTDEIYQQEQDANWLKSIKQRIEGE